MAKLGFRGLTSGYSTDGNGGVYNYTPVVIADYLFDTGESTILYNEGSPGSIVRRYVPIVYNDLSSSWTSTIRRNGIDTDNVITVPSATTGHFYSDEIVTYNVGDQLTFKEYTTSDYPDSIWPIPTFMIAYTKAVRPKFMTWFFTIPQNTTMYFSLIGTAISTESKVQTNMLFAGSMKYFCIYVGSNTLTGSATYTSRKNGANGNLSIIVPGGTTGYYEDTTTVDEFVAGDDICFKQVNAAGGTSIRSNIVCEVEDYSGKTLCEYASNISVSSNRNRYVPIIGTADPTNTESEILMYMPTKTKFSNFQVAVGVNSVNGNTDFSLRVNQTNIITITVGASTTGVFSDTSSTATAEQQQSVSIKQAVAGSTGGITLNVVNVSMDLGDYDLSSFRKDIKIRPRAFAPGVAR